LKRSNERPRTDRSLTIMQVNKTIYTWPYM
jgi:hypothetical protein